jgi:hypothetical protein
MVKRPKRKAPKRKRRLEGELMAREDVIPPKRLTVDELRDAVRRFGPPVPQREND